MADEYVKALQDAGGKSVVATEFDESQADSADVPMRPSEKRRLHWEGKTCTCGFVPGGRG